MLGLLRRRILAIEDSVNAIKTKRETVTVSVIRTKSQRLWTKSLLKLITMATMATIEDLD